MESDLQHAVHSTLVRIGKDELQKTDDMDLLELGGGLYDVEVSLS